MRGFSDGIIPQIDNNRSLVAKIDLSTISERESGRRYQLSIDKRTVFRPFIENPNANIVTIDTRVRQLHTFIIYNEVRRTRSANGKPRGIHGNLLCLARIVDS
jgi:hypothetical protein